MLILCFYFFVKSDLLGIDIWGQDKYQILFEGRIHDIIWYSDYLQMRLYIFFCMNKLFNWMIYHDSSRTIPNMQK